MIFGLTHALARRRCLEAVQSAPDGYIVRISEPKRTLEQNALQWAILGCFSRQRQWTINGRLEWLTPEEWKEVLTAAFTNETVRLAAGLHGGVVMLGARTSSFGRKRFSEWIDFLQASAAELGVDLED